MRPNQEFSSTNFDLNNFDLNKKYLKYFLPTNVMGLSYCTSLDVILNIFGQEKLGKALKKSPIKAVFLSTTPIAETKLGLLQHLRWSAL